MLFRQHCILISKTHFRPPTPHEIYTEGEIYDYCLSGNKEAGGQLCPFIMNNGHRALQINNNIYFFSLRFFLIGEKKVISVFK